MATPSSSSAVSALQGEIKTQRVDRWRTNDQKLRWCAAALLAAEARFRRVKGYAKLPLLVQALKSADQRSSTIDQDAA